MLPDQAPLGLMEALEPVKPYSRPCRWCEKPVSTSTSPKGEFAVCERCRHGQCSKCKGDMAVGVSSRPPQTRLCRRCRADAREAARKRPIDREALLARVLGGG